MPIPGPRAVRSALGLRRLHARRRRLAAPLLKGEGLEIGALHLPMPVPRGVRVRYVDRYDTAGLRRHYPELAGLPLVDVDVVADGETLDGLPDGSQDFVVANHFIEHTQDPLAALGHHLRVLRPGGVAFYAVPDARSGVDAGRPITSLEHVVRDHREGPAASRAQHYHDWARDVDRVADPEAHAAALMAAEYSIHFHVWDPAAFAALVDHARDVVGLPLTMVGLTPNRSEFVVALRRT